MFESDDHRSGTWPDNILRAAKFNLEDFDFDTRLQVLVMFNMLPEKIKKQMRPGDGAIIDALFQRWNSKYAALFRILYEDISCATPEARVKLKREIPANQMTAEERQVLEESFRNKSNTLEEGGIIRRYLEDPANEDKDTGTGGPFFANSEEVEKFVIANSTVH